MTARKEHRVLVLEPEGSPRPARLDDKGIEQILGGYFAAHPCPMWAELGVVCLVREDAFPFWSPVPLAPPNIMLPIGIVAEHAGRKLIAMEPVFGSLVFVGFSPDGEPRDIDDATLIRLSALLVTFPRASERGSYPGGDPCLN